MAKTYDFLTLPDRTDQVNLDVLNNNFKSIADRITTNKNNLENTNTEVENAKQAASDAQDAADAAQETASGAAAGVSALSGLLAGLQHLEFFPYQYVSFTNGYGYIQVNSGVQHNGCVATQAYGTESIHVEFCGDDLSTEYIKLYATTINGTPFSGGMRVSAIAFATASTRSGGEEP